MHGKTLQPRPVFAVNLEVRVDRNSARSLHNACDQDVETETEGFVQSMERKLVPLSLFSVDGKGSAASLASTTFTPMSDRQDERQRYGLVQGGLLDDNRSEVESKVPLASSVCQNFEMLDREELRGIIEIATERRASFEQEKKPKKQKETQQAGQSISDCDFHASPTKDRNFPGFAGGVEAFRSYQRKVCTGSLCAAAALPGCDRA